MGEGCERGREHAGAGKYDTNMIDKMNRKEETKFFAIAADTGSGCAQ